MNPATYELAQIRQAEARARAAQARTAKAAKGPVVTAHTEGRRHGHCSGRTDVVDLSHPIRDGMPTYPGLPRPVVGLHVDHTASGERYAHQAEFAIGRLALVGNTGTYLDSPFHRYPDGADVSELPLARLVDLPTVVIDARAQAQRGRRLDLLLVSAGPLAGRAVLIRSDWDRRWGTDAYWHPGPHLGPVTLQQLVHARPALVGVDFWNVDDPDEPTRPAHTQLLGAGIPIVEHLTRLGDVPGDARTYVVPLAIEGAPSVPVRAFALGTPSTCQQAASDVEGERP